jgi:hypothetical protein
MMLFKTDKYPEDGTPPCKQNLPEMAKLIGELKEAGVLISTEGLQPSAKGARVKFAGGKLAVTDGPFAEAKEMIAGVALVDVKSKAEAIELAKRFIAIAGEGESEIFEVVEPSQPKP